MAFFSSMFVCNLTIPIVMIIAGYMMYKHPPKQINGLVGYRTTMSRLNLDTWKFAQTYCGKLWVYIGCIVLVPTIIVQLFFIFFQSENPWSLDRGMNGVTFTYCIFFT